MNFDYTKKYYCCLEGLSNAKLNALQEFISPYYERDFAKHNNDEHALGYQGTYFGSWLKSYPEENNWIKLTYGEWIQFMEGYEELIKVGDHKVEFLDNRIKVGCTEVSHEVLGKIYNRALKQKK